MQHQLVHHGAYIVDGHTGGFHLEKLRIHIALQDDFVADHRDDLLELLELGILLGKCGSGAEAQQANEGNGGEARDHGVSLLSFSWDGAGLKVPASPLEVRAASAQAAWTASWRMASKVRLRRR